MLAPLSNYWGGGGGGGLAPLPPPLFLRLCMCLIYSFDEWDNRVFGVSEAEAERMDPQQKHVLECVHMAMEDGGFTRTQLHGSNTGVYIGKEKTLSPKSNTGKQYRAR